MDDEEEEQNEMALENNDALTHNEVPPPETFELKLTELSDQEVYQINSVEKEPEAKVTEDAQNPEELTQK
jgi:hypothetical protein